MGLILWLVIGGVVGWLASIVMKRDGSQGIFLNIVVGIVGAMLGGWLIGPMVGAPSINSGEISIGSPAGVVPRCGDPARHRQSDLAQPRALIARYRGVDLFEIHVPVAELMLRGTLVYWLLFLIFRFVLRRDVGAVGIADILLLVDRRGCRAERDVRRLRHICRRRDPRAHHRRVELAARFSLVAIRDRAAFRLTATSHADSSAVCRSDATCGASSSPWTSSTRSCGSRASRRWRM